MMKLLPILIGALTWGVIGFAEEKVSPPKSSSELFQTEKVWPIHLTLTAEQFAAMTPAGDTAEMGRMPQPPGESGQPQQENRAPGQSEPRRRGGFDPGRQMAQAFFKAAGKQESETISAKEFSALAEKWFDAADTEKTGKLDATVLQRIMMETLAMGMRPGEAGRPGPGGSSLKFSYAHATLDIAGLVLADSGLRYSGNNTWQASRNTAKKPFKVNTNEFVKKQKIGEVSAFSLRNNINDPSALQEVLAYQLYREAGVPSPRTSYARVYLTVPGKYEKQYLGLYSVVENINKTFAKEHYESKDGAIFKPETRDLFSYLGDDWSKYEKSYDPKTKISATDSARVIAFAKLVTNGTDKEFANQLGDYLDIDEVARYFAVTVWTAGLDSILSMGHNYFVYLDAKTNRFQILPWDLDHTFGAWMQSNLEQLSITRPYQGNSRFLVRLFANEAFKKAYLAHMAEFQKTIFAPEKITADVTRLAGVIREAVKDESKEKLAYLEKVVSGQNLQDATRRSGPGMRGGMTGPGVVAFAKARSQSVVDQLAGKTTGSSQEGGRGQRGGPGPQGGFSPDGSRMGLGQNMPGAESLFSTFDANKDGVLERAEFVQGFSKWFGAWDTDKNNTLSQAEVQAGLGSLFSRQFQRRGGPPGAPLGGGDFEAPMPPR
ncbi:MAG: CotH kinase family protein [Puniceicoccales bacterium]|jgi:spore coat protein CotH/Ca2+-binding EF-hand superfamily protein|nr:CotH kinase family protein [Puniceicoccales bacterium]